jgi:predicted RNase H-like HicB family nuclease
VGAILMAIIDKYSYMVTWSNEDQCYLAKVQEFPSVIAHGDSIKEAVSQIKFVVGTIIKEMKNNGEYVPIPNNIQ